MIDKLNHLFDELDAMKVSLALAEDHKDEKAIYACKSRIFSLDSTVDYYWNRGRA